MASGRSWRTHGRRLLAAMCGALLVAVLAAATTGAAGMDLVAALLVGATVLAALSLFLAMWWDVSRRVESTRRALGVATRQQRGDLRDAVRLVQRSARVVDTRSGALARRSRTEADRSVARLRAQAGDETSQLESYVQLLAMTQPRAALPKTRGWAASPDVLLALIDRLLRDDPAVYFEAGSGASTVFVASAIRAAGLRTRVISAEHDPDYAQQTQAYLVRHGLTDLVELRVAPLEPYRGDPQQLWYSEAVLQDVSDVGLVFIDGPPGDTGPDARSPALSFLSTRMAHGCNVLVDDADRPDERHLVERWMSLDEFVSVEYPPTEKGLAVLTFKGRHS